MSGSSAGSATPSRTWRTVSLDTLLSHYSKLARRYWWLTMGVWALTGAVVIAPVLTDRDPDIACTALAPVNETCTLETICDLPREDWMFTHTMQSTVSTFGLVCDRQYLKNLLGPIFFIGWFIGAGLFGFLSDQYGRRPVYGISVFLYIVVLVLNSVGAVNPYLLLVFRMLSGCIGGGLGVVSYVAASEYMPPNRRAMLATRANMAFAIGAATLPFLAMIVHSKWRQILMLVAVLMTVYASIGGWLVRKALTFGSSNRSMPYSSEGDSVAADRLLDDTEDTEEKAAFTSAPFTSAVSVESAEVVQCDMWGVESLRWLASRGHLQRANSLASLIASQVYPNENVVVRFGQQNSGNNTTSSGSMGSKSVSASQLFTHTHIRPLLLSSAYLWFVASFAYYGLSLNAGRLGGGVAVGVLISSLVEVPALLLCEWVLERYGRRQALYINYGLGGICCVMYATVSSSKITGIVFAMVGKFGIAAAFGAIYVYSLELFPTSVRNLALGICSQASRIGGILAPMLVTLGESVSESIPMLCFGVTSILAAVLVFTILPETRGKQLKESLDDYGNKSSSDTESCDSADMNHLSSDSERGESDPFGTVVESEDEERDGDRDRERERERGRLTKKRLSRSRTSIDELDDM